MFQARLRTQGYVERVALAAAYIEPASGGAGRCARFRPFRECMLGPAPCKRYLGRVSLYHTHQNGTRDEAAKDRHGNMASCKWEMYKERLSWPAAAKSTTDYYEAPYLLGGSATATRQAGGSISSAA